MNEGVRVDARHQGASTERAAMRGQRFDLGSRKLEVLADVECDIGDPQPAVVAAARIRKRSQDLVGEGAELSRIFLWIARSEVELLDPPVALDVRDAAVLGDRGV